MYRPTLKPIILSSRCSKIVNTAFVRSTNRLFPSSPPKKKERPSLNAVPALRTEKPPRTSGLLAVAAHLPFLLQRVLGRLLGGLRARAVAVVAVSPARLGLGHLFLSGVQLPAVQRRRQRHRIDLDVLPVLLGEYRVRHARRREQTAADETTTTD